MQSLKIQLHQNSLVVSAAIQNENLTGTRGFRDDIFHLDMMFPKLEICPVEPFIPRIPDRVRRLSVVCHNHQCTVVSELIDKTSFGYLLPSSTGITAEVCIDFILPSMKMMPDIPSGHYQPSRRYRTVDRTQESRCLSIQMKRTAITHDRSSKVIICRWRQIFPHRAFIIGNHSLRRNHSIFLWAKKIKCHKKCLTEIKKKTRKLN
mmetsp:Transcript_34535/g.108254  ORF Transcript_34535/g.108254 Transcript_34535/m.108254 type:complete len:206 (+) Transcript_34535:1042-1659(+)